LQSSSDVEQVLGGGRHVVGWLFSYCTIEGADPLQFSEHLIHLVGVDVIVQPGNPVPCDVLTELIDVAFCPLAVAEVLVLLSMEIDRLVVVDPEGSVPSLVG